MEINIKRSNRKSVSIKINEKGEVFVYCPYKFSIKKINNIIKEKEEWINKAIIKVNQRQQVYSQFYNYSKLLFFGKEYDIVLNNKNIEIGDYIIKKTNSNYKKLIKEWLKKQANKVILNRLEEISNSINIDYNTSKIISARKKWGSCDSNKNINLNFRLIMLPVKCIDYVCIHELCHIKHMNHSKQYWELVETFVPNYKEIQKVIKQLSFTLEIF